MAGLSCKSGFGVSTTLCGLQRADAQCTSHGGTKQVVRRSSARTWQEPSALPHCACRLFGRNAPHRAASILQVARIWACNSSADDGAASVSSDIEQPSLTSAAEQKQANMKKRMEAARTKATEYQQSTNTASAMGEIGSQTEAEGSMSDLDSDSDDDEDSLGQGRGYGVVGLLLNQKPKKESFYKNAKREISKPGVLPDIEIVRGKKVVSERRPLKED